MGIRLVTEGAGFFMIALGIIAFSVILRCSQRLGRSPFLFSTVCALDLASIALMIFGRNLAVIVTAGLIMNFFHGMISGYYLTRLSLTVPQQSKGVSFGIAYGIGSFATWFMSLVFVTSDGRHLLSTPIYALLFFTLLVSGTVLVNVFFVSRLQELRINILDPKPFSIRFLLLMAGVVILLSLVKNFTLFFPSLDTITWEHNIEFSRLFYALGLISAGFVNDRNRKTGLVLCLLSLLFPFLSLISGAGAFGLILWIISFFFAGFYTVYRTILFSDVSVKSDRFLPLAGAGLALGRIGDSAGCLCGSAAEGNTPLLIILSLVLLAVLVPLCLMLYKRPYASLLADGSSTAERLERFEAELDLSDREKEVLVLILTGRSNRELASDLYIAESTVKFHVKKILRKADCQNRCELCEKFRSFS